MKLWICNSHSRTNDVLCSCRKHELARESDRLCGSAGFAADPLNCGSGRRYSSSERTEAVN